MKYKVLIIEDNREHYIKIQEKLMPDNALSRLPFEMVVTDDMIEKRKKYLRELNTTIENKIKDEECLSEREQYITDLLRVRGNLMEAKRFCKNIIMNNYQELRLIICDLKVCENELAGEQIIRYIRTDSAFENIKWYVENIPIIILTEVDGVVVPAAEIGGINCRCYKKYDVLYERRKQEKKTDSEVKRNSGDDVGNLEPSQSLFSSIVELLATHFDKAYNENMNNYKVSLSFTSYNDLQQDNPVPHREFVKVFAHCLYSFFTKKKVYYDEDNDDNRNLDNDMSDIYRKESEYVIVFISGDYNSERNSATQKEWRAIKEKYECNCWKKVIFVILEKEMKNNSSIKDRLGLEVFYEKYVDFSDLRDSFYNINDGGALEQLRKNEVNNKECKQLIIGEYNKICTKIQERIKEKIVKEKMGITDF